MYRFKCVYVLTALALALPFAASAQLVTATLPAGTTPQAVAVNPATNKIYVANKGSNNLTVIDGASDTTSTIITGTSPNSVAVNPVTNKIYVANNGSANVTVIDGLTNSTTSVAAGTGPYAVAVNPVTNKIYVANYTGNNVTVIDGATNTATTVVAGSSPYALAVNAVTNKIYVANSNGSNVTVIDGASNSTATVPVGAFPLSIAVNPITNKIYVANYGGQPTGNSVVTVIDGASNSPTSIPVGRNPFAVAVNPVTNKIYVANGGDAGLSNGSLTVIDGASNTATTPATGGNPVLVSVDTITNQIFVGSQANASQNSDVLVIDGATGAPVADRTVGLTISSLAVNPVTDKIYVANSASNNISVIDGDTYLAGPNSLYYGNGSAPSIAAVNPVTNKIYAAVSFSFSAGSGNISYSMYVVDPVSGTSTQLPISFPPSSIVVDSIRNKIYVGGSSVVVIDGVTNAISLLSSTGGTIALNTVTNRIYALNSALDVIDAASGAITIVPVPTFSLPALAVNEVTDKIYLTNYNNPGSVTVVDGNTNAFTTVPVGQYPNAVAVNPVTNKIYVLSQQTPSYLTVIDGVTNATTSVVAGTDAFSVAVNALTNKIYVADYGGTLQIFDGATLNVTTQTVGNQASVLVNPVTNQVYIYSDSPSVLDGASNFLLPLPAPFIAANPITNQLFTLPNLSASPYGAVIKEQQTQPQPLTIAITPLPANQTNIPNPAFTFTASSTTSVPPNAVFYQVDTWQGTWTTASGANPTFTATLANLQPGVHTLFAYAADGGEASPTQPLIGAIQSYQFLYSPPLLSQTVSFPAIPAQSVGSSFPLSATASSGLPVSFAVSTPSVCQITGGSVYFLAAGTCVVTASQSGSPLYAAAPSVSQNVTVTGGSGLAAFISSQTPGTLRNNYGGFVGFTFTVGAAPIQVSWLGRFFATGNTATHVVKLVQMNGTDVPGGSVTVATLNGVAGQYQYAPLANPITLSPNTSYFLVSQEGGADSWYNFGPVSFNSSVASGVTPVYTDGHGNYVNLGSGYAGESYVPVNFLYGSATSTNPISASITSPAAGTTLTGSASVVVSTTGAVAALQIQVDGVNRGASVPVSQSPATLTLDTTQLTNGAHTLTVIATGSQSNSVTSAPVSVTVSNSTASSTAFVTGQTLSALRNNYTGFVGMAIQVANTPIVVSSLGRFASTGNSQTHLLKLVQSNGVDLPGGAVSLSLAGATVGTYQYAALASSVTLAANSTYYLVSQETAGGDQWHDYSAVTSTSVANVVGPVYTDAGSNYVTVQGLAGDCYVPLSFLYGGTTTTPTLSATITSPQSGATLSGSAVSVAVTTTGSVTSLQLQIDGTNQGSPVSSSPLTLNTTLLTNGAHTLTVVVTGASSNTAVSPGVSITVNNGGPATTAFITSQTPSSPRNNYSGFVGTSITVGSSPLTVTQLGRLMLSGDTGTHLLKLVQSNGTDVTGGSATVSLAGASAGTYVYATLSSPVTLSANTSYYLVSQETAGGDSWYDLEPVTSTAAAQVNGPTYTDGHGNYVLVGGLPNYSYVTVNFQYH